MKHSEKLDALAKAMSGLQSEIRDAEKDTQGHGYKYADLYQVLSLIRPLLLKHGLSFTQHVSNADDKVLIETMVMHESGQWMSSEISMPPTPNQRMSAAQSVGSAITYGRRYALTAIFGITQTAEDTDAPREKYEPPSKDTNKNMTSKDSGLISKDEEFQLSKIMFDTKTDSKRFCAAYGVKSFSELTKAQYTDAIKKLNAKMKKEPKPEDYASV